METLIIGHHNGGWCVLRHASDDGPRNQALLTIVSGPHREHADAVQAAETRAYRVAQRWSP